MRIILGIDPGTTILGYGVIKVSKRKHLSVINLDVVHLQKITGHYNKLRKIFECIKELVTKYKPHEIAIEAPFYGKNVQSMLKLGRAQGVAIAAGLVCDVPIFEYAPKKIKMAITGNGNASKDQVAGMLKQIVHFDTDIKQLDATDGLAAAICHCLQGKPISTTEKKYNSWEDYIEKNPNKIN